ncbi:MAG: hypothetical protein KDD29_08015 [Flavobacteriales bacterium]|nr:hypothetical protein [Flavobacteriales bacterium]
MKNPKNIIEWIVALIAIIGFAFDILSFKTVLVTLLCSTGLYVLLYKDIWFFENPEKSGNNKNKDFVRYMSKTKKTLSMLFIVIPIVFIILNLGERHVPNYANDYIAYHFSQPNEFVEIQGAKLKESRFELISSSDSINCLKNIEIGFPKVAIERIKGEHYLLSCSYIIDDTFNCLTNSAYTLFFWLLVPLVVLIIGMLIADKISPNFA